MLLRAAVAIFMFALVQVNAQADYGVDCSFPIHSKNFQCENVLGDRQKFYDDYMEGCRKHFGKKGYLCDQYEKDRIAMSMRQPQSMVNYTSTGFKKIRAPESVMKLLANHWELNKDKQKAEVWAAGNIYVNHWEAQPYTVSVEDRSLKGTNGFQLKNQIWDAVKPVIEEWTGMEQRPSSQYGIRVYKEGAVLSPHVDRLPLVSSCIINVAQDVDEPWPLEVYDRHDRAVNVTMEPGDMVLYESGSLIHGRPFPLKGNFMANIFIHFEPTGRVLGDDSTDYLDEIDEFFPPYLVPDSPETSHWKSNNPHGWDKQAPSGSQVDTSLAHLAAREGDVQSLAKIYSENKEALTFKDRNGWQPIHEAARSGHKDAVEMLLNFGADINARTRGGKGISPLNVARTYDMHKLVKFLEEKGAKDIGHDEM